MYKVESTFPVLASCCRPGVWDVLGNCEVGEGCEGLGASLMDFTWTFSGPYTKHKAVRPHFLSGLGDIHLLSHSNVSQLFFFRSTP